MRFLVIGAGAVGVTFGVALEHLKHEVAYLVRPGRRQGLKQLLLIHASSGVTRCRERPTVFELGERPPPFEWVLVCTRGDQLDEAAATIAAHARPDAILAVAAAAAPEALERLRAAHPGGPLVTVSPMFSSWSEEPNVWRWFLPPLLKTLVSGEGDPRATEHASELATQLTAAGLPARTVPSLRRSAALPTATGMALLAGWELAGWDLAQLAGDRALRKLTAQAMAEAARAVGDSEGSGVVGRLLAHAPAPALGLLLAAMPRLVPENARTMWRHHGPKIRNQTRTVLDGLLEHAKDPTHVARLRELRDRLPPC